MEKYLRPIVITVLFVLVSSVLFCAVPILISVFDSENYVPSTDMDGMNKMLMPYFGIITILSGILTVFFAWAIKMSDFKKSFDYKSIDWRKVWIPIVGAFYYLLVFNFLSDAIRLPDFMTQTFNDVAKTATGVIAICIIGPICEELIFRESIIRCMLNNGATPKAAVITSSLLFSIAHGNPAQMFFAFFVGILFAMLFIKSGNIILSTIMHILNNSFSVIMMNFYHLEGENQHFPVGVDVVVILLCVYPAYRILRYYFYEQEQPAMADKKSASSCKRTKKQ